MRIFTVISALLLAFCDSARSLQEYGIQDYCGSSLFVKSLVFGASSSGILTPRKYGLTYAPEKTCTVTLTNVESRSGFVVSVRKLDLRPDCKDVLKIGHGSETATFCNNYKVISDKKIDYSEYKSYYYPGEVEITFNTGPGSTVAYDGFEVVFTVTKSLPCGSMSWEYRCDAPRCIANDLTCDGHNHCGDRSDQRNCFGPSTGTIVGAVFGCLFLAVAVFALIFLFIKKRRNVQTGTTIITTQHPPVQPPQPMYPTTQYPPSYAQQGNSVVNPSYR